MSAEESLCDNPFFNFLLKRRQQNLIKVSLSLSFCIMFREKNVILFST